MTSFFPFRAAWLGVGLLLAGCMAPPPPPPPAPAPVHRVVHHAPRPRTPRCEPAPRPPLSEAQKAELFQDFDAWQRERDPGDAATPAPAALPAPRPATHGQACRVAP